MTAHSFHVLFVLFFKILRYFTKILYINTSISKTLAAAQTWTIRLYFCDFTLSTPPGLIMNLWFYLTSVPLQWNHLTGNDAILW